jgi:hypothetical protein
VCVCVCVHACVCVYLSLYIYNICVCVCVCVCVSGVWGSRAEREPNCNCVYCCTHHTQTIDSSHTDYRLITHRL